MSFVNAIGDACPLPVIKTKKELSNEACTSVVVMVDNKTAVDNLQNMATMEGCTSSWSEDGANFRVEIVKTEAFGAGAGGAGDGGAGGEGAGEGEHSQSSAVKDAQAWAGKSRMSFEETCVVISSDCMGSGNDELGKILMKSFVFTLTQLDKLPKTILLYNNGVKLSCEGSDCIEDLQKLENLGAEILNCGTCLEFFGIAEKLQVGKVTNMYYIVERQRQCEMIIRP